MNTDSSPLQHNYRKGGPLSTENTSFVEMLRKSSLNVNNKSKSVIQESIKENEQSSSDSGTMLDESQLLDV